MNFRNFKITTMHWQQRQDVVVRFENKRETIDPMSQATGEQTA